jgi:hypothetical protein
MVLSKFLFSEKNGSFVCECSPGRTAWFTQENAPAMIPIQGVCKNQAMRAQLLKVSANQAMRAQHQRFKSSGRGLMMQGPALKRWRDGAFSLSKT